MTLSLISIPALQRSALEDGVSALTLAKEWRQTFEAGKAQNPPVAAVVASAFAYLAWSARSGSAFHKSFPRSATIWYSTAAVLTFRHRAIYNTCNDEDQLCLNSGE